MNDKRMLIAFAHPDDESFGMGATIARYVAEGAQIDLICATNGEAGTVDEAYLQEYGSVSELRIAELMCAAETLGLHHVYQFNYRDSGMTGSPDNDHPDALIRADRGELVGRIVQVIREVRPQVVVTFDPFGGYGHPDHIAMHEATVAAFHAAGDPSCYPEQLADGLEPYSPQRLYHPNWNRLTRWSLRFEIFGMRLRGEDPRRVGRNKDIDLIRVAENIYPTHVQINIRRYMEVWETASGCHRSQGGGLRGMLPRWLRELASGHQAFTQMAPPPASRRVAHDLFAGVAL